jgi:Rieske Fe-S protein
MAAAAAMLAEACGTGYSEPLAPDVRDFGANGLTLHLIDIPALATIGGIAVIPTAGMPVALVRRGEYQYDAWWLSCPHQGFRVDVTATGFECKNHGAHFALDGRWLSGQKTGSLSAVPYTYDPIVGVLTLGVEPKTPVVPTRPAFVLALAVNTVAALQRIGGIAVFGAGNGYPCAVVRTGASEYLALSTVCAHRQYVVDPVGDGFTCPGHGATFSSRGTWTGGTATTNLTILPSAMDPVTGILTVTIP